MVCCICILGIQILWIQNRCIINGGRKKWLVEDRPVSKDIPQLLKGNYKLESQKQSKLEYSYDSYVKDTLGNKALIDVRSLKEFTGEISAPPEYPTEHAQRGGHIPEQSIFHGHSQ